MGGGEFLADTGVLDLQNSWEFFLCFIFFLLNADEGAALLWLVDRSLVPCQPLEVNSTWPQEGSTGFYTFYFILIAPVPAGSTGGS